MGSSPNQDESIVLLVPDQQPVRFDVTFPVRRPVPGQPMLPMSWVERMIRQCVEEGVSEGAQSVISQGAAAISTDQEMDIGRILEEAARGASAGMFLGAGGSAAASRMPVRETPAEVIASEPLRTREGVPGSTGEATATIPPAERRYRTPHKPPETVQGEIAAPAEDVAGSAPSIEEEKQATPVEATPSWAAESIVEETEETVPPERRQRSVFPGDDRKVETEYTVVEADRLKASHTPSYAQRSTEEYPAEIQGRAYHGRRGRQAREHTEQMVSAFDAERALDCTVSTNGTTIIRSRRRKISPPSSNWTATCGAVTASPTAATMAMPIYRVRRLFLRFGTWALGGALGVSGRLMCLSLALADRYETIRKSPKWWCLLRPRGQCMCRTLETHRSFRAFPAGQVWL